MLNIAQFYLGCYENMFWAGGRRWVAPDLPLTTLPTLPLSLALTQPLNC